MTVISAATESEKNIPLVAVVVRLWPSICHRVKCWGISSSSPLTLPHPFITHLFCISIIHPSIHPRSQMFVSSLSPRITPPPPPSLVATETADSGRVGGCLRAHAALPHAVLSQDISASVLLLWPWHADSSGGWVTNLSATQRLFVRCPRRMWLGFKFMLSFICVPLKFARLVFPLLKEGLIQLLLKHKV